MRRQGKLKNNSHDLLGTSDIDDFCDLPKTLKNTGSHGNDYCSAILLSLWWRSLQSLTEEKEVANDEEGEELEVRQ